MNARVRALPTTTEMPSSCAHMQTAASASVSVRARRARGVRDGSRVSRTRGRSRRAAWDDEDAVAYHHFRDRGEDGIPPNLVVGHGKAGPSSLHAVAAFLMFSWRPSLNDAAKSACDLRSIAASTTGSPSGGCVHMRS